MEDGAAEQEQNRRLAAGQALTHGGFLDAYPSWTPDGQSLLFSSNRRGVNDLWKLTPGAGAAPKRLTALIEYDVTRDGHSSDIMTAWLAFRQEAITNPIYRPLCDTREAAYFGALA